MAHEPVQIHRPEQGQHEAASREPETVREKRPQIRDRLDLQRIESGPGVGQFGRQRAGQGVAGKQMGAGQRLVEDEAEGLPAQGDVARDPGNRRQRGQPGEQRAFAQGRRWRETPRCRKTTASAITPVA
jgi:hypothetical protein